MTPLQQKELELLTLFIQICSQLELRYYLVCGTALGAVKYGGFIPWDDDVDVSMPREDYEKFLELAPGLLPQNMLVVNYRNDPKFQYYITRVQDTDTRVEEERIGNDSRYTCASIDIFPVDGTPNNKLLRKIYFFRVLYHRALMSLCYKDSIDRQRKRSKKEKLLLWVMERIPVEKLTTPYKQKCKIDKLLRRQRVESSRYIGNIMGAYRTREIVPKEFYGEGKLYDFENMQLRGMAMAHEYLEFTYGDYMRLPPEDQRKTHFKILELHGKKIDN